MTKLIPQSYTMSFSDKLELVLVNHGIQSTAGSDVERGGRAVDDGEGGSSDDGKGGSSDDGDGINELVLVNHGMQSTARTGNSSNEVNNNKSRGSSNPKRKRVVESDNDD